MATSTVSAPAVCGNSGWCRLFAHDAPFCGFGAASSELWQAETRGNGALHFPGAFAVNPLPYPVVIPPFWTILGCNRIEPRRVEQWCSELAERPGWLWPSRWGRPESLFPLRSGTVFAPDRAQNWFNCLFDSMILKSIFSKMLFS